MDKLLPIPADVIFGEIIEAGKDWETEDEAWSSVYAPNSPLVPLPAKWMKDHNVLRRWRF